MITYKHVKDILLLTFIETKEDVYAKFTKIKKNQLKKFKSND